MGLLPSDGSNSVVILIVSLIVAHVAGQTVVVGLEPAALTPNALNHLAMVTSTYKRETSLYFM